MIGGAQRTATVVKVLRSTVAVVKVGYPERLIADLPRAWLRLLDDEAMIEVENRNDSLPTVTLGFAASVFVTDAWVAAARSSTEPYLTARTLRSELRDRKSPILRPAAIRRESAAGLNILVVCSQN